MGLSVEFYAGDPHKIGPAFTAINLGGLRDGTVAHSYADLSLHLSLTDFNILSEQVRAFLGRPPVLLLDSLESSIGGTPDESEAAVVSRDWVETVAAVPIRSAPEVARRWLRAVSRASGEEVVTDSPDSALAVSSLIK